MTADIHVHIERLVVDRDALGDVDPRVLGDGVCAELTALIAASGMRGPVAGGGGRGVIDGAHSVGVRALARGIASAIHAGAPGTHGRPSTTEVGTTRTERPHGPLIP